jgi:MOSC domain-containing protein
MTSEEPAGRVAALWRFPVKSMLGERVEEANVTPGGLVGDRAYALVDGASGKVVSAKSVQAFPDLFACRAAFVEPPPLEGPLPPVRITLPDGSVVTSGGGDSDATLSSWFGREVHLASVAPADFTIDQYHPDVEGLDPAGHRDEFVEQKLGAALFAELGAPSPVAAEAFFDVFPMSVLTTSTLNELNRLRPESRFDERRFRMNVVVRTGVAGFIENEWVGRVLELGDGVRLGVAMLDPRCVMTTLAQEELPRDNEILRTLSRHNRLAVAGEGRFPCCGVYAVVEAPGTIRTDDPVLVR